MKIGRLLALVLSLIMVALAVTACGNSFTPKPDEDGWYATWGTAIYDATANEIPTEPALKNNTIRQQVRVSMGGDKIKLTFSNAKGDIPVIIEKAHVAKMINGGTDSTIDVSTDTVITFGGEESIRLEPGQIVTSDEISFSVDALDDLAVTLKMGKYLGGIISCHRDSRTVAWVVEGDHVSDETISGGKTMTSWYYLEEVSVWKEAGAKTIVCIGDSITDGAKSSANKLARWSDELSRQLQANGYDNIGVVNKGISGDWSASAASRALHDVLDVAGVRYCIVLIGINDIGFAEEDISERIIEQYKLMIEACHEQGIEIYGGTITPVKPSGYYSELHELTRETVNEFIRSADSGFDGVIDFEAAVADPADPDKMLDEYVGDMDYLHPGDLGYAAMGETAFEALDKIWSAEE